MQLEKFFVFENFFIEKFKNCDVVRRIRFFYRVPLKLCWKTILDVIILL